MQRGAKIEFLELSPFYPSFCVFRSFLTVIKNNSLHKPRPPYLPMLKTLHLIQHGVARPTISLLSKQTGQSKPSIVGSNEIVRSSNV